MNWLASRGLALASLLALGSLTACDKGTDLNVDLPDTTDISTNYLALSLGGQAATVQLQPVSTLKADRFLVGRLQDNVAGTTTARSYLNVVTVGSTDSLPSSYTSAHLDSVVMVLTYDRVYGSATAPVRLDVAHLPAKLDERQVYNSTTPPSGPLNELLATNVPGKTNRTTQTTTAATDTSPAVTVTSADPSVRFVLQRSNATGGAPAIPSAFFSNLFGAMNTTGFNQARLDAQLRGLALLPSVGYSGSILSIGRNAVSRIEFFFHDDSATVANKWHAYPLLFGQLYSISGQSASLDPRYYTQLDTDLTGSALSGLAGAGSAGVPAAALSGTSYLQEGTGLGTRIAFANLTQLEALRNVPGLAINRAELRIPIKPYSNLLFPNPAQLYVLEADANNQILQRTINYTPYERAVQADGVNQAPTSPLEVQEAVGTIVNATTTQPYYSVLLTSYLQAYLNNKLGGDLPASLVLVPNIRRSTTLSLSRAAIDADNIQLYVYYSQQ